MDHLYNAQYVSVILIIVVIEVLASVISHLINYNSHILYIRITQPRTALYCIHRGSYKRWTYLLKVTWLPELPLSLESHHERADGHLVYLRTVHVYEYEDLILSGYHGANNWSSTWIWQILQSLHLPDLHY